MARPYMKTAASLLNWQNRYSAALNSHNVRGHNLKLAKEYACTYGVKFATLERSPMFERVMLSFTRTKSLSTPSAWLSMQSQLEQEEAEIKARLRLPNGDRKKLTCSRCPEVPRPRLFVTDDDLANHVRRKHRTVGINRTGR
ncbi:hypothetical protein BD410DRAFT_280588 [Rickenella mellea]|uniref:Uncharacterized protein n=1 Tax=Rickenella mellea TaxID=50990 RepID=A0A4Y7Q3H7_9AGAM|nr:hypothetical protein BD410DRAFT_280588 [Rickenella mellea]